MTIQIGHTIILSAIILFTSCGKSEQQVKEDKKQVVKQKTEQLKTANKKAISDINHKHNAVSGWDSLESFTYVLQEMFVDENKLMNFKGEIKDIIKSDSTYLLKVHHNSDWPYKMDYLALISMSREKLVEIKEILKSDNHSNIGCFILKVSKIISSSPKIKPDLELEGEDSYSYMDFDFDANLLIFKGDLVDFHINEILPKDNE